MLTHTEEVQLPRCQRNVFNATIKQCVVRRTTRRRLSCDGAFLLSLLAVERPPLATWMCTYSGCTSEHSYNGKVELWILVSVKIMKLLYLFGVGMLFRWYQRQQWHFLQCIRRWDLPLRRAHRWFNSILRFMPDWEGSDTQRWFLQQFPLIVRHLLQSRFFSSSLTSRTLQGNFQRVSVALCFPRFERCTECWCSSLRSGELVSFPYNDAVDTQNIN